MNDVAMYCFCCGDELDVILFDDADCKTNRKKNTDVNFSSFDVFRESFSLVDCPVCNVYSIAYKRALSGIHTWQKYRVVKCGFKVICLLSNPCKAEKNQKMLDKMITNAMRLKKLDCNIEALAVNYFSYDENEKYVLVEN